MNDYLRTELEYESDLPYEALTSRVQPWNYGTAGMGFLDVADTLRSAMTQNPALHVYVACGHFDQATPFLSALHTVDHMGLDPSLKDHVRLGFYEAGHMIYLDQHELQRLKRELAAFIASAAPR